MTFMDLIKSNKKRPAPQAVFAVFNVSRCDQTAYILSTDQSCLAQVVHYFFFTVKSTLNYTHVLRSSRSKQ